MFIALKLAEFINFSTLLGYVDSDKVKYVIFAEVKFLSIGE